MTQPSKILPYQFETIEGDLVFKEGATHELRPNKPAAGPGDAVRVRGADAASGSNANGGDGIIAGGAGDGTGKPGVGTAGGPFALPKANRANFRVLGGAENFVFAGDDAGNTELFAATPLGDVQITKNGALDVLSSPIPATDAAVTVEVFAPIIGGPGDPTVVAVGRYNTLNFPTGLTRSARAQGTLPEDFRAGPTDDILIVCKYTIAGAGGGTVVRLQTAGNAENNPEGPFSYDLDVSGAVVGQISQSPVIATIPAADVMKLANLVIDIQRTPFGGEFGGAFQLVSLHFIYKSKAVSSVLSDTVDVFTPTPNPQPNPGVMAPYGTLDFPAGQVGEVAAELTVDKRYATGTPCLVQLSYAMSSAFVGGTVSLTIAASINNTINIPPQSVMVQPANTMNVIALTIGLIDIGAGLNPLDSVVLIIDRVPGDTHPGDFRLVSASLVMGGVVVPGAATAEIDYTCTDRVAGAGPPDTDSETVFGVENETYELAIGTADGQDVTFVYRCRRPGSASAGISSITIPYKISAAVGNNGVVFKVYRGTGALIYMSAKQTATARTEFSIPGVALASLPAIGERFLVLAQAFVDNGATADIGAEITVAYE